MSDNSDCGRFEKFLRLKHTGKLVALINTAIYSFISYFVINYLKGMIGSQDKTSQSLGVIMLVLFVGALGWFRDFVTDTVDMQSPANKERDEHKKTKGELKKSEHDLSECRRIIHAIRSNITNTIMQEPDDKERIQKIVGMMVKINTDSSVNNVAEVSKGEVQKDYLSLFSAESL